VQAGLGGGFVASVAQHAGLSEAAVTIALSTMLPLLIQHFAPGGQSVAPQGQLGGVASFVLARIL